MAQELGVLKVLLKNELLNFFHCPNEIALPSLFLSNDTSL